MRPPTPRILEEQPVSGGTRLHLELRVRSGTFPAILQVPQGVARAPAALLLHGFSSRGAVMAETVGQALLRQGVASLAPDLPQHGTRGNPHDLQSLRQPLEAVRLWRLALQEAEAATAYLRAHAVVDGSRVGAVGYSLGSFLTLMLAARQPEIRAVVLAAGGDLPQHPVLTALARPIADPLRAVRQLAGRPLLMVNGRYDPVIRPEQAERLFAAAREPKELRWWEGGHTLSPAAILDVANWLARTLEA
ncbi:hypothetical protein Dcar01_03184 [Deinococcus carri]|uniref:Dienelactone hydrolase domain-containing protein n=1 Tax=Deinococcus carri TaxID=1211323 RepID=A0ABP9WAS8_9DEIO